MKARQRSDLLQESQKIPVTEMGESSYLLFPHFCECEPFGDEHYILKINGKVYVAESIDLEFKEDEKDIKSRRQKVLLEYIRQCEDDDRLEVLAFSDDISTLLVKHNFANKDSYHVVFIDELPSSSSRLTLPMNIKDNTNAITFYMSREWLK